MVDTRNLVTDEMVDKLILSKQGDKDKAGTGSENDGSGSEDDAGSKMTFGGKFASKDGRPSSSSKHMPWVGKGKTTKLQATPVSKASGLCLSDRKICVHDDICDWLFFLFVTTGHIVISLLGLLFAFCMALMLFGRFFPCLAINSSLNSGHVTTKVPLVVMGL
jgi:hypothetical protein